MNAAQRERCLNLASYATAFALGLIVSDLLGALYYATGTIKLAYLKDGLVVTAIIFVFLVGFIYISCSKLIEK